MSIHAGTVINVRKELGMPTQPLLQPRKRGITTSVVVSAPFVSSRMFLLAFCVLLALPALYSCGRTGGEQQQSNATQSGAAQTSSMASGNSASTNSSSPTTSTTALSKTIQVNESTLLIRLSHAYPEHVAGALSVEDVIRSLYTTQIRSGSYDTLTVLDLHIVALKSRPNTFVAVTKTLGEGRDAVEQKIDVFAFQNSGTGKFLLGHTSLEPETDDFSIENLSASAFQLTQAGEYAVSFEYDGRTQGVNAERTRMLYFYRLRDEQQRGLEQVLEMCVFNKSESAPDLAGSGTSSSSIEITQNSTVSTQYKWGKDLYSIVVVKSESRKNDVAAGGRGTQTVKTRIYLDWDDGKYAEVLTQDLGRASS
jgi:hypothetical protein